MPRYAVHRCRCQLIHKKTFHFYRDVSGPCPIIDSSLLSSPDHPAQSGLVLSPALYHIFNSSKPPIAHQTSPQGDNSSTFPLFLSLFGESLNSFNQVAGCGQIRSRILQPCCCERFPPVSLFRCVPWLAISVVWATCCVEAPPSLHSHFRMRRLCTSLPCRPILETCGPHHFLFVLRRAGRTAGKQPCCP